MRKENGETGETKRSRVINEKGKNEKEKKIREIRIRPSVQKKRGKRKWKKDE